MRFKILLCYFVSQTLLFSLTAQSSKIHPELIEDFGRMTSVEAMLVFENQIKFRPEDTRHLGSKARKGAFVFHQLQSQAKQSQITAKNYLEAQQITYQSLSIVNAISATLTEEQATTLSQLSNIKAIIPNPWIQQDLGFISRQQAAARAAIEWGVSQIKAPELWALGFTGQGVTIGGQDTGYEYTHPTIFDKYRGNVSGDTIHDYNWHDAIHSISPLNNNDNNPCGLDVAYPCDDNNHGTHTMGTMVGDDGEGNQIGVAPGAKWVACRNMERGWGSPASYLECFEWFLAPTRIDGSEPDPAQSPHVIANSWSCPEMEGCSPENFELFDIAINNLRAAGVVVVVSAGNDGPECGSISKPPSMFPSSFSVGATDIQDTIAGFSSRGPSTFGDTTYVQPQVVAPGVNVRSAIRGGGFANFSGTSMAGPHTAGAVAVLISALPELAGNVLAIERIFRESAVQIYTAQDCGEYEGDKIPNAVYGYGRIDLESAYALAQTLVATEELTPETARFLLSPNPVSDELLVLGADNSLLKSCTVIDLAGREIRKFNISASQSERLNVADLPAGAYLIRITTTDGIISTQKFVKR